MPKILHGIERSPPVRAVLITARAIGVKLELQTLDLLVEKDHKKESYLKLNPAHTIPTLDDDGFVLWESRAIMTYLVSRYGKDDRLYPKDVKQRALVDNMLHFDNGAVWASASQYIAPQLFKNEPPNADHANAIRDKLTTLERILSERPYVAGDHLTIADISVVTTVMIFPAVGISLDPYPNIKSLITKVRSELPVYDEVNKYGHDDLAAFFAEKLKL